jgi:ankyrin repeat protein
MDSSLQTVFEKIKINDKNIWAEIMKYISPYVLLYKWFGTIPTEKELLDLLKLSHDYFLEFVELLLSNNVVININNYYFCKQCNKLLLRAGQLKYSLFISRFHRKALYIYLAYGGHIPATCTSKSDFNDVMRGAAGGGHMDIVQEMLRLGADDFGWAMRYAAGGGHMDIVQEMIRVGKARTFDWAMQDAAGGGHMDIVQEMIRRGAKTFNKAMIEAARGGHLDIVQEMIRRGAIRHPTFGITNVTYAMAEAASGGHMDIVQEMIRHGGSRITDFTEAMANAAEGGHMDIVQEMIRLGAAAGYNDFNATMISAARGGHMNIVQEMLKHGANNFTKVMDVAAQEGHMDIVQEMIQKVKQSYDRKHRGTILKKMERMDGNVRYPLRNRLRETRNNLN